ncbi:MAG: 2-C-methyl-D-erythritol 4-phosphate cytidylyltransferase [Lachnospiraceae bacterium]|nr:2-C-methyl-D-erythritol 4-phosphate cytidylyltransferase [Lachnospiraceae bacterium]
MSEDRINRGAVWAVVPAAGSGSRMGTEVHKQFLMLQGKELLARTLQVFQDADLVEGVVLVCAPEDRMKMEALVSRWMLTKVKFIVTGGETRGISVKKGLEAVPNSCSAVLIHDGARPFVTPEMMERTVEAALKFGGSLPVVPVKDTIKVAAPDMTVRETPVRSTLFAAQTPQTFRFKEILEAYRKAVSAGDKDCTDDSEIMEKYGTGRVRMVEGSYTNIKITTPEDLLLAERILLQGENE